MSNPINQLLLQPSPLGEVFVSARDIAGPASYTTGGVLVSANAFALLTIKLLVCTHLTPDGLYYPLFKMPRGAGYPTATIVWFNAGSTTGVESIAIATAGSGQTPGTYVVTATGGGGAGATASITVAAGGTVTAIPQVLTPGSGYTSAPTFTLAAGGTPATFTASLGNQNGVEVAPGTNLSTETLRILALGN